MKKNRLTIPVFYACDDNFIKFTAVSICSLIQNCNEKYNYKIYVLNANISENTKKETQKLKTDNVEIYFIDVESRMDAIGKNLPLRDYYSKTTYFRLLISEMFPEYEKVIYVDSDTVIKVDLSELYNTDIGDCYLGACHEQVMVQTEVFGEYVEKVLGVDRNKYFNAGILLINCKQFREQNVYEQFVNLLDVYTFVVTQDQDYLNVICKDKIFWLDDSWNVEVYGDIQVEPKDIKIVHYIMVSKPWHYKDCRLKNYFWEYAKLTPFYQLILREFESYTDQMRKKDTASCEKLAIIAKEESMRADRYALKISSGEIC